VQAHLNVGELEAPFKALISLRIFLKPRVKGVNFDFLALSVQNVCILPKNAQ
jgi:hypothetical protein